MLYLIAARLVCAVGEKSVTAETTLSLSCGGHTFTAKGCTVTAEGWKAADHAFRATLKEREDGKEPDGGLLPELAEGQELSGVTASPAGRRHRPTQAFHGGHAAFRYGVRRGR